MKHLTNSVFMLFVLTLLAGCAGNNNGQTEIIRKVKIEPVQQADSLVVRTFSGMVNEANQVNLAFRVAGPIQKIMVKEGDYVRVGQAVAQMDTRDYEVQLAAAQAQYEQVKAEADRVIELHNRESVAGNDYDKAVSGLKMVESQLKHAKDQPPAGADLQSVPLSICWNFTLLFPQIIFAFAKQFSKLLITI